MWFSFDLVFFIYRISTFPEIFIYKLIELLQKYFKQDTYILFDCLYDDNAECIDTFTLFEYLQKNNIKSYYIVNKNNKAFDKIKKKTHLKNIIVTNSSKNLPFFINFILLKTHTVVSSFGILNNKFERFIYKNKFINYVFSDHGIFFMKLFALSFYSPSQYNYFGVSNDLETKMVLENSNWTEDKLIKNGLFRYDNLVKREDESQKEIFIMLTWRRYLKGCNLVESNYFKCLESLLSNKRLVQYSRENNVKIKIAFHHELIKRTKVIEDIKFENKNVEIIDMVAISEQIKKTNLFITDFSSIAFDFMYLDIPVIFYRFDIDLDENTKDFESITFAANRDSYLYNCYYDEENTVNAIIRYINNGFVLEEENKEKNKVFYTYLDRNNVCRNFVNIIDNLNKEKLCNG